MALSVAVVSLVAGPVGAQPNGGWARSGLPTAAVALGDGFLAGAGGRWQGNAGQAPSGGDSWGTDRAAYACSADHTTCDHDVARVYGDSAKDGCDRSDVPEVESADLGVSRRFDLACAGGGVTQAQLDQLAAVAAASQVRLVVVSVGDEDRALAGLTTDGVRADQSRVESALVAVRAVLAKAGYAPSDYRLVLQSYPSPVPRAAENRYPDTAVRQTGGGCPLSNAESNQVRNDVVPALAAMEKKAATAQGAEFLDLQDAFQGHEVCSRNAAQADASRTLDAPQDAATAEWARFALPEASSASASASDRDWGPGSERRRRPRRPERRRRPSIRTPTARRRWADA